jgi:hypothetical protein
LAALIEQPILAPACHHHHSSARVIMVCNLGTKRVFACPGTYVLCVQVCNNNQP